MKRFIKDMLTSDSWRSTLLVLAIEAIILLIRKTDSFSNPQFWAEDGAVFFLQQYEHGASAIFQPYAGYLHLVPRLVALFADSFLPYFALPFFYNYSCLIITLLAITSIFSPRFEINHKPLLALTLVLVPHYTNEVFLTITNIQWILSIPLIVVLMKKKPDCQYGKITIQLGVDFTIIFFCGFTGPFIVFLMPFFAWKWFKDKSLYNYSVVFATITIALIQLRFILFTSTSEALPDSSLALDLNAYSAILGHKVVGGLFLGHIGLYDKISYYFLSVIYFALIFMILKFSSSRKEFITICLGIQSIILVAVLYKFRATPTVLIPAGNGPRYCYVPYIMLVWSLIALLEERERWKKFLTKMALIFILFSSITSGFHSVGLIDYNWKLYSKSIGREDVVIPINPKGWEINVKAHPSKSV